jgi:multiple sugar transport system permease protein
MAVKIDDVVTPKKRRGFLQTRTKERPENLWRRIKRNRLAYALIAPAVICMLFVHFVPGIMGIYMSFIDLKQRTWREFLAAPFVGTKNYEFLFSPDNTIAQGIQYAARNTILYSIVVNIGTIGLGMAAALLINREFRGRGIIRTLLLTPWIVPTFVVGLLWGFMWRSDYGIINRILVDWLNLTGGERISWLQNTNVFWAIIIPTIWRSFPFTMVMLLSGLQTVPHELYEAAHIDGASAWQRFWRITIPLLKPILAVVVLWGIIGSAYAFNIVYAMFGNGAGYPGEWGDLLQPAIQRQSFGYFLWGVGAAASTLFMITMLLFVFVWYRVFRTSMTAAE